MTVTTTPIRFDVPPHQIAAEPPEARGLRRDEVRLLVAGPDGLTHTQFASVPEHLRTGDLVVVNTSPTMAAAVAGHLGSMSMHVHFSTRHDDGTWTIELRRPDRSGPVLDAAPGGIVRLVRGEIELLEPADGGVAGGVRLWRASVRVPGGLRRHMRRYGQPIRYGYVEQAWPLSAYQTVFADRRRWPASAEMPSAGRPFSFDVLRRLRAKGVEVAAVELHTGVSSQESHEPPQAERYAVSPRTASLVNRTRASGGRVVAVGTTVTRALESAADPTGRLTPRAGWTELVLRPDHSARVVDGLITGWHPPEASHLDLLQAVAGHDLVAHAYEAALEAGYLWHEFGDSALLLPVRQ